MSLKIVQVDAFATAPFAGNPAAVFPVYVFFITAIMCFYRAEECASPRRAVFLGLVMLLTSLAQTHNFNVVFNDVFTLDITWFTGPPGSWLLTLIPLIALAAVLWRNGAAPRVRILAGVLILAVVGGLVYPAEFPPMSYYAFSGTVSYLCFMLVDQELAKVRTRPRLIRI